jgi:hypothetical protein
MDAAWRVVSSDIMQATTDHDALAYRARTEAALLNAGSTDLTNATLLATLDDLWALRYTSGTAQPGFGLSSTFDAFQDGTTNGATTIYTYTTAMAALAYLDGYEVLADTDQLDRARDLLDTLRTDCWGWTSGTWLSVWYSAHANDKVTTSQVVNNINTLMLAVLARIDRIDAAAYDATKRTGMEAFTAAGEGYNGVPGRWRYRMGATTINDLAHHAFIVHGLAEAGMTDLGVACDYLWSHFLGSSGAINTNRTDVMGTTNWGPGDALVALCFGARTDEAETVADLIESSVDVDGISSYATASNARSVCRYGLGLAVWAASVDGDGSLFP